MPEKVGTHHFTVPVAEEPMTYDGGFTSVSLAKPAYVPGESIRMICEVWAWTSSRWWDITWGSFIIAYDHLHQELTRVAASHIAVPGVDDYETYDVDLNLGTQPPEGLSGYLELWCEGSPAVKVAEVAFSVPAGKPEEPEVPGVGLLPWILGGGLVLGIVVLAKKKR